MLWLHYVLIVSLIIAISSKYISPTLFWVPAFFGLAFPFIMIANLLFLLFWFAQFKPVFIFGAVACVLAMPTTYRYIQFSKPLNTSTQPIKVTSYNSMLFDLYNWTHNNERRASILNNLAETAPDVLCLQEFYTSEEKGDYNNIDTVTKLLRLPFNHVEFTTTLRQTDHWGIATFSKFPIINKGRILFHTKSNNICIYTDVVMNKDTVRIYNIHLQSISFSKKDNQFLEEIVSDHQPQDRVSNSKNILRRLKLAFIKRSAQVEMIALHMKTSPYKIILCGDFNDTAASFAYQKLSQNLNDAFIAKGNGFGRTYKGKWPQFRIDYILYDPSITCINFKRSQETFTDHYPITAFFTNLGW